MKNLVILFTLALCISNSSFAQRHSCNHRSHNHARGLYPNVENMRSDTFDILNYELHLNITDFGGQTISGEAIITWVALQPNLTSIPFDLLGFTIQNTSVDQQTTTFQYNDTTLRIDIGQSPQIGDTHSVSILYSGVPARDASWGGFYFNGGYAWNLGVGFQAKPHNYGRAWYPCFDNFIERASYSMYIETQPNHIASSMGQFIDSTHTSNNTVIWHYEMHEEIPTYLSMCAVSDYTVVNDSHAGLERSIPIELYSRAQDTVAMKNSFTHLGDCIHAFETGYGPYQWNKVGYTVVPFNAGAMEHASNITYPRYAVDGSLNNESLMAHELAHSWWGNLITCATAEDMWINEGWASYSSYLFFENVYGWERAVEEMESTLLPVIRKAHLDEGGYLAVSGLPHNLTYGTHTYDKGSLVAWNLRAYLGDSAFFSGIADLMQARAYGNMNSAEFRDDLSAITGKDLTEFFNDWVFNGGYPAFEVNEVISTDPGSGPVDVTVEIEQKLRGTNSYFRNVPLEVTFVKDDGSTIVRKTTADSAITQANFILDFVPEEVELNTRQYLVQAVTEAEHSFNSTGALNFNQALVNSFNVQNISDTAHLKIRHYWVAPDPVKDFYNKPYRLSDYRYWKVTGELPSTFEAEAVIFYDGNQGNGFLDSGLVSITEDSLVLLHRTGPEGDWIEYPHYTKNTLGSSTNGLGVITLSQVELGEYTFANLDHTVLGVERKLNSKASGLHVSPNPSQGEFRIEIQNGDQIKSVQAFSIGGNQIEVKVKLSNNIAHLSGLASGSYIIRAVSQQGEEFKTKHIVK